MRRSSAIPLLHLKKHTTKPKQFLATSSQSTEEGLPSHHHGWVPFAACSGQGQGSSPPSKREMAPLQPTKPTPPFEASQEVGSFTAATYGDIFQTLLTALVRILATLYGNEKKTPQYFEELLSGLKLQAPQSLLLSMALPALGGVHSHRISVMLLQELQNTLGVTVGGPNANGSHLPCPH